MNYFTSSKNKNDDKQSERNSHNKLMHFAFVLYKIKFCLHFKGKLRLSSDAILHMSRTEFEFWPTQIILDRMN